MTAPPQTSPAMSTGMTAPPRSMRASVLTAPATVAVQDRAVPEPTASDVLVRVLAVGVCGSDAHYFEHGRIGDFVVTGDIVLGHEAAGVIVAVGPDADPRRIGERVSIEPQHECGTCVFCRDGRYNLCVAMRFLATPPYDGAFTEFIVVPSARAHTVPDQLTVDEAALLEPLSVAIAACRRAGVQPGTRILITGAGPIGLLIASTARHFGASRIAISDPVASRREHALRRGADVIINPRDPGTDTQESFDVYIDASGAEAAIAWGIEHCAPGGFALLVGMGPSHQQLPTGLIQSRELTVSGIFRYRHTWPLAIELAASGHVPLTDLITGHFGLNEVDDALTSSTSPSHLKTIVLPAVPVDEDRTTPASEVTA